MTFKFYRWLIWLKLSCFQPMVSLRVNLGHAFGPSAHDLRNQNSIPRVMMGGGRSTMAQRRRKVTLPPGYSQLVRSVTRCV